MGESVIQAIGGALRSQLERVASIAGSRWQPLS